MRFGLTRYLVRCLVVLGVVLELAGCDATDKVVFSTGAARPDPDGLGAHGLVFQRLGAGRSAIATPAMRGRFSLSIVIVAIGRGDLSAFSPPNIDGAETPATPMGGAHAYSKYPKSGTALYMARRFPADARDLAINALTPPGDEITLAAVELKGSRVVDYIWSEETAGRWVTSQSVSTNGPAILVAIWWGDAGVRGRKTAIPNNGFKLIEHVLEEGALVQCAVAVKSVAAAGRYDVSWLNTPKQGAQLWLVAVAD